MAYVTSDVRREYVKPEQNLHARLLVTKGYKYYDGAFIAVDASTGKGVKPGSGKRLFGIIENGRDMRDFTSDDYLWAVRRCFLVAVGLSGVTLNDIGKAVFGADGDDDDVSLTPVAGKYIGTVINVDDDGYPVLACDFGAREWQSRFTIADAGTQAIGACEQIVELAGGGEAAVFAVKSDGTVTKLSGTANTDNADTASKLCLVNVSGTPTIKNNLGAEHTVLVKVKEV